MFIIKEIGIICRTIIFSNYPTSFIVEFINIIHMARVKIEEIIDHSSSEMRESLRDSVNKVIPEATFNEGTF